jgi:hypothetical protein
MAADITTVAAMVATVSGSDHCQPMMSCDEDQENRHAAGQ